MRKRIKYCRVGSSKINNDYKIEQTIIKVTKKHYFVSCFGKLVEITEEEAIKIESSIKIIIR